MIKFISIILVGLIPLSALASNIKLEKNQTNCRKINGWATTSKEAVAKYLNTSISSVVFLRAEYGINGCLAVIDTPSGPKKFFIEAILSSDKGRTAFAVLDNGFGGVFTMSTW